LPGLPAIPVGGQVNHTYRIQRRAGRTGRPPDHLGPAPSIQNSLLAYLVRSFISQGSSEDEDDLVLG
jgi:hypothetical protein